MLAKAFFYFSATPRIPDSRLNEAGTKTRPLRRAFLPAMRAGLGDFGRQQQLGRTLEQAAWHDRSDAAGGLSTVYVLFS